MDTTRTRVRHTATVVGALMVLGAALSIGLTAALAASAPPSSGPTVDEGPPPPPQPGQTVGVVGLDGQPILGPDGQPLEVTLDAAPPPVPANSAEVWTGPPAATEQVDSVGVAEAAERTLEQLVDDLGYTEAERLDFYAENGLPAPVEP